MPAQVDSHVFLISSYQSVDGDCSGTTKIREEMSYLTEAVTVTISFKIGCGFYLFTFCLDFQRQLDEIIFPLNITNEYWQKLSLGPMRPTRQDYLIPFGLILTYGFYFDTWVATEEFNQSYPYHKMIADYPPCNINRFEYYYMMLASDRMRGMQKRHRYVDLP